MGIEDTLKELQERFALIYTGQRRLARNLLRDVVGGYIGNRKESLDALHKMKRIAVLMQFELEQGNIDAFADLLKAIIDKFRESEKFFKNSK